MKLAEHIMVKVYNTDFMRSVLRDIADEVSDNARKATTYEEREARERFATAIQLALEPEQLEDEDGH